MITNSAIFTTTVFGKSSGLTATEQAKQDTTTQELFLSKNSYSSIKTQVPRVPSNQGKAKE